MTINELNSKLTKELIKYLHKTDHINTGRLVKSISFNTSIGTDGDLELNLDTLDYIQYLDDGKFLDDFFSTTEFQNIMFEWYNDNLI